MEYREAFDESMRIFLSERIIKAKGKDPSALPRDDTVRPDTEDRDGRRLGQDPSALPRDDTGALISCVCQRRITMAGGVEREGRVFGLFCS